jgi:glycosyltransferase involved in cell wall biosynthesis
MEKAVITYERKLGVGLLVNDLRIGGAERQLIELARGLDKSRFRVLVATLYSGQPLERELRHAPGVDLVSLERKGKWDFGVVRRLALLLRDHEVGIIQPFLTPSTAFGLAAALMARTPVKIVTERCGVRLNTSPGNKAYRFVEDRLTRFADAVVPNSEAGRDYVLSRGISEDKVRVIYNGVAPERSTCEPDDRNAVRALHGIRPDEPVVGIVASLTPAKDHETFLLAASIIRQHVPSTRFLIVGDGPLRERLEARAAELGLSGTAVFAGHRTQVAPYIGAMDVAVLSSCDHEGCSNFLLEAMGLSRPVVATDVGGNRELFSSGEAGLFVEPGDAVAMATATLRILTAPYLAEEFGARGRTVFERRFTLPTMVRAYENLYTALWQEKSRSQKRDRVAAGDWR